VQKTGEQSMATSDPDRRGAAPRRILATVTFNSNQLRAHLEPLLRMPELEGIVLVCDAHPPPLPKLRSVVPPRMLVRVLGRAGAKFVVCVTLAIRIRPDWVIGFNLVPHGITAVTTGRLTRTSSLYYMIGGAEEWEGGGWRSDNNVLSRLRRPNKPIERFLLRFIRRATRIAVMGETGRAAIVNRGIDPLRVFAIPASVDPARFAATLSEDAPTYDLLTIGSLIERKRMQDFIRCVALVGVSQPDIRAAIVGDGPLESSLRALANQLDANEMIDFLGFRDDTAALLRRAKVFMLASRYEGLSIALGEAMVAGVPAVVTDVGETSTLVRHGINGFICPVGQPDALAATALALLADDGLRVKIGAQAASDALALLSPEAVAARYRIAFADEVE
jgi:glycosyltransferase involved in cell wall biosynthesis